MAIKDFRIKSLVSSGGDTIQLSAGSLLLLVGPNNSGKSAALREIGSWLAPSHLQSKRLVLSSAEFQDVPANELLDSMGRVFQIEELPNERIMFSLAGGSRWEAPRGIALKQLYEIFYSSLIQRLDTETRLTYANPVGRLDVFGGDVPTAGIHWLQKDDSICRRVSGIGADLIINWGGGSTVGFHVGDAPSVTDDQDRVSSAYLRRLNELPRLEQLGDGIRSFVTTVIAAHVGPHPVLLIDEPEAFLHPPQAARLGEVLGRLITEQQRQAIVATHSADFIRGALSASSNAAICRLERRGSLNHAHVLSSEDLQQFWSSPLLRSSQAITGLFHEGIVIREADADARFYEAVLASVASRFSRPINLYFVHGGGKGALAALSNAYRRLQIPTAVIADLDLLKNYAEFSSVYAALGGDLPSNKPLYSVASSQLGDQGAVLPLAEFTNEFRQLIVRIETEHRLSPESRRRGSDLLENAADWSEAKKYGIDKLKGGARENTRRLIEECATVGLFLVPKGELEGWWRDGPAVKRDWIAAAIDKLSSVRDDFAEVQTFMQKICDYFGYKFDGSWSPTES